MVYPTNLPFLGSSKGCPFDIEKKTTDCHIALTCPVEITRPNPLLISNCPRIRRLMAELFRSCIYNYQKFAFKYLFFSQIFRLKKEKMSKSYCCQSANGINPISLLLAGYALILDYWPQSSALGDFATSPVPK